MRPDKFLNGNKGDVAPKISDGERADRLESLGIAISAKREEAISARKASGIEAVWLSCEEAYLGIDDMNRHEFSGAKWAKPTSMTGPVTTNRIPNEDVRSSAFVGLTSRYVDGASSKLSEILLPIDDKAFSLEPTPIPDLINKKMDKTPVTDESGQPVMRPAAAQAGQPQAPQQAMPPGAAAAPGQPVAPAQVPMTVGDKIQMEVDAASDAAEKAERRIYDWMVESKYPAETRKVIKDAARIGTGILKGPFPDIRKSQAGKKVQDGFALEIKEEIVPTICWIDRWNFYPADGCGENIHDGDGTFECNLLSYKKLRELKEDPSYLPDQIDKVLEEGPNKMNVDASPTQDKSSKNRFQIWYAYICLKKEDLEVAMVDNSMLDGAPGIDDQIYSIVTMVNDTVIRAVINPMDSGKYPYNVINWSRRPGHWAGVGVAEQVSVPQRIVNAATRALLNNAGISAGVQIIIDQLGIVPANGSMAITPNKIWYRTAEGTSQNVRDAFNAIEIPNVYQQMMGVIEYGMKLAEESTGIPLVTQGQAGPTTPQTFGAAELQDNNAHTWLRSIGYAFDDQITEPVVRAFYEWLLLDPSVPDDEKGDFHINASGSIAMVERAIQEQTLLSLLQAVANPAFKINPEKLFAEYLKGKRLDPRKIQYSDDEWQKLNSQPPAPPIQIAVEQAKGQNAIAAIQAKANAELQVAQQEAAHEQQMLQSGGAQPHQAAAMAAIERERIRAVSMQSVQQNRANAELARAEKEKEIAYQNGQFDIQKLQLQKELALLDYANKNSLQLNQVKAELAKQAMQEDTKRQLAAAEIQLSQSENATSRMHEATQNQADRNLDVAKHAASLEHARTLDNNSLVRDQMSTPNTTMIKRIKLSTADKRSQLWLDIVEHLNQHLESLRMQNDGDKSEVETAKLRGRIAEVKSLLALGKDELVVD